MSNKQSIYCLFGKHFERRSSLQLILKMSASIISLSLAACSSFPPQQPKMNTTWLLPKAAQLPADLSDGKEGKATAAIGSKSSDKSDLTNSSSRTGFRVNKLDNDQPEPAACTYFDSFDPTEPLSSDADIKSITLKRDECIYALKLMIDAAWQPYRADLLREIGAADASLDATATIAGAISAATTKVASKIFAVVASGASGTKTAIDNDLLQKISLSNALHQMDADRNKAWAQIQLSQVKNIQDYTMSHAISDLASYYMAGTLADGLEQQSSDAGATAKSCQNAQQTVSAASDSAKAVGAGSTGQAKKVADAAASAQSANATNPSATSAEQCSTIQAAVSKVLIATVDTPDLDNTRKAIKEHIAALGMADEPRIKAIDGALGIEPSLSGIKTAQAIWSAENRALLDYFEQLTDQAKIQAAEDQIKLKTGEEI